VTALFIWSFANIGFVTLRAEAAAKGRPYCLQIQKTPHGDYKPVSRLSELSGLSMRTESYKELSMAFHAVLVIDTGNKLGENEPELMNGPIGDKPFHP
jgi:hypothetical protein